MLGYIWEGRFFLFGEGEVSIERFNEVVGTPNISFEKMTEDELNDV